MKKSIFFTLAFGLLLGFSACSSSSHNYEESSAKIMTGFAVGSDQATIDQVKETISIVLTPGSDATASAPTAIQIPTLARVSPKVGEVVDFTDANLRYVVTAENGDTKTYSITATVPIGKEAEITNFAFKEDTLKNTIVTISEIEEGKSTISVVFIRGTKTEDIKAITPVIAVSPAAIIDPIDVVRDFNEEFTYTVTSEDKKTTTEYTVSPSIYLGTEAKVTDFTFNEKLKLGDVTIAINEAKVEGENGEIYIRFPYGTKEEDIKAIAPDMTLSIGATISPKISDKQNFNESFVYTVKSEDGKTTNKYTVDAQVSNIKP